MAVTVNGSVGAETYINAVTTKDYTFTVASGSNLALVLTLNFGSNAVSGITAVWDQGGTNQSMTQLVLAQNVSPGVGSSAIFGLRNPTVGSSLTLRVSWTTTSEVFIAAICFAGVDQTSNVAAFPHTASYTVAGSGQTVSLTSATGNMVVGCQTATGSQGTPTGTTIYDDHFSGAIINAQAEYDNGASSVNVGSSGVINQSIAAVDVAAAAGGGSTFTPIVMMVV